MPQGREIIPQLTVRENLLLGYEALPGGMGKHRHIDPFVYELFPVLESFLERRGGDLSGGQQQQLAIARALLGKPRLLLLDEPTEAIQPSVVQDIERAVRQITATGISVLLVEQHLHFVRQADWYYAMQKGGVVANGPWAGPSLWAMAWRVAAGSALEWIQKIGGSRAKDEIHPAVLHRQQHRCW